MARVVLARSPRDALAELDSLLAEAMLDAPGELKRNPGPGYQLHDRLTGRGSYRVGVYRIIHERRDRSTLHVMAIRHRAQAYDTDPRLTPPTWSRLLNDAADRCVRLPPDGRPPEATVSVGRTPWCSGVDLVGVALTRGFTTRP